MIILGLDEAAGFTPVGLTKPREMKSALAAKARAAFDPPIAIHLDHAVVDGEAVIVGIVDELDSSQKPCRVSGGQHKGAWIRAWDGDYRANALASAGLPKPLFYDDALRFTVVLRQRSNNGRRRRNQTLPEQRSCWRSIQARSTSANSKPQRASRHQTFANTSDNYAQTACLPSTEDKANERPTPGQLTSRQCSGSAASSWPPVVIVGIDYDSDEHPPRYAVVGTDTDDNHHIVIHARPYPPARPNLLALLTDPGDLT